MDSLQFDPNGGDCFLHRNRHNHQHQFPEENPAFDTPQRYLPNEFAVLLSTSDPMDSALWPTNGTPTAFAQLFHQIQDLTVQHQKHIYTWWDLCRQCKMDPVVEHLLKAPSLLNWHFPEAQVRLAAINGTGREHQNKALFLAGTIGDVELNSSDGTLRRAHSLLMRLKLKAQLKPALVEAFERRLRRIVSNFSTANQSNPPTLHFWSSQRLWEEMEQGMRGVHWRMAPTWLLIATILALAQCRQSTYESRPLLGICQAVALLLAILSAYSVHLANAAGGHLNPLLFPLPYILTAIGVLTFANIDGAFERYTGISMHPTEKMAFLFIWDGPNVVLGLLWLVLLCLLSVFFLVQSPFLLQLFLALAAGLVCLLLFCLTFLLVCWLGTARRIASGLKWFQIFRSGDQAFNEKQMFDYDAHTCIRLHEKLADLRPCFARRFGQLVCGPNFRMFAFALFCVASLGSIAVGGMATARAKLEPGQFVSPQAQSRAFLDRFRGAFPKYEDYLELTFDGPIDYLERKEQILSLLNWPVEAEFASRSVSWLLEFDKFQKTVSYRVDEESTLPLLTHVFLQSDQFRPFAADLSISQGQIHRSRMYLELTAKGREQSELLIRTLLERARRLGLPLFVHAPFSFSIGHDIQVLPHLHSALFWLSTLSALLSGLQPALAICLFASNVFLSASVHALSQLLAIPLNIVTLGTLLAFGLPLNSLCLLTFAHHFFNAGPRQRSNPLRIQYAFQCALWPISMACSIAPLSLSLQFLLPFLPPPPCPPIVWAVWKMVALCSALILAQTLLFLPSLLTFCADLLHGVFTLAGQLCDENASEEMTVDPMAENVYFVPSFQRRTGTTANGLNWAPMQESLGYGPHVIFPLESPHYSLGGGRPLCMPPAYQPPPIDYMPSKSTTAQHVGIQHSRQHSQVSGGDGGPRNSSPRIGGSGNNRGSSVPPIYSPPNRRRSEHCAGGGIGADSGNNSSFSESLESRADLRIRRGGGARSQPPPLPSSSPFATSATNLVAPSNLAPSNRPATKNIGGVNFRQNGKKRTNPLGGGGGDEQIYEEPDTTPVVVEQQQHQRIVVVGDEPAGEGPTFPHQHNSRKSSAGASPGYRRRKYHQMVV